MVNFFANRPLILASAGMVLASGMAFAKKERPNVVLVLVDDLGLGDVNCFRSEDEQNTGFDLKKRNGKPIGVKDSKILTPNLDRFAKDGIRFNNFYSGSTVCGPSRCALLTGMHTGNPSMSVRNNGTGDQGFKLKASDYTIGKMLQGQGYITGIIGKYGMMGDGPRNMSDKNGIRKDVIPILPSNMGFDYAYGNFEHISGHYHFQGHDNGNFTGGKEAKTWEITEDAPKDTAKEVTPKSLTYSQDLFMEKAKSFLDRRAKDKKRFFLHFNPIIPHAGLQLPKAGSSGDNVDFSKKNQNSPNGVGVGSFKWYQNQYKSRGWNKNHKGGRGHYGIQPFAHAAHAAMISRLDRDFGLLRSYLKKRGLDKNTIIVFTSDNGPHREGGADPNFFSNLQPIRGIKRDLFEGGIKMPTIMWGSSNIMPKSRRNSFEKRQGAFWDFMPTLADWCGAKIPAEVKKKIDGKSFAGTVWKGAPIQKHEFLYWEFPGKQAVRKGSWKALRLGAKNPKTPIKLFNLEKDPQESKDLAKQYPEIVQEFAKIMRTATKNSPNVKIPDESFVK